MTSARVLPWRRDDAPIEQVVPLLDVFQSRWPGADTDMIRRAWATASAAHGEQRRKSGEPYILHPLSVAKVVADMGLDDVSIAAALLHDAVEDTGLEIDDVKGVFGDEVARLVDGVTKLDHISFDTKVHAQAATMRKMLVAMANDLRVLIIKLADRLHNMSTIAALKPEKQAQKARETLDIYAPLAHRLGMQDMRQRLEDLAFAALYPKRYAEIDRLVAERTPSQDRYVDDVLDHVREQLESYEIEASVYGRHKHLWSIYEKMDSRLGGFNEIFDLIGIRIIVDSSRDCYAALGAIHGMWKPVHGRFKDYIAMPKFNLYQSLHTTVVGLEGAVIEVQIRTEEHHQLAEYGVAAHWRYKHDDAAEMPWLDRMVDWESETADPDEFMESLRGDLEHDEVFVFTPKGDVVTLPIGATAIDFAYSIHTDVGHTTIGAKVNGRLVPLDRPLESGDTIEMFTSKLDAAGPSLDWVSMAITPRARNKIRQWFARERRGDAIEAGREALLEVLQSENLPTHATLGSPALLSIGEQLGYFDLDSILIAVGENHLSPKSVAQRLSRELRIPGTEEQLSAPSLQNRPTRKRRESGVHVDGFEDQLVRIARCCNPVPGDEIIGFVTRGRGVSVHRSDCTNAVELAAAQGGRLVDVEWDQAFGGSYVMSINVKALDRPGLLAEVTAALADSHVNILGAKTLTGGDQVSAMHFDFELFDPAHLEMLLRRVRSIDAVYEATRAGPESAGN
ncbi:MAG: bifunctional (p)ppGpp synthetase/guanosine-3',5'-bis(diphosphate) 3'-pyrophosphohydrolase [Actinomycetia bacterium]|nr:bifunctional (p)ppGpp synthetase/guanosine-3',5'-bis(diphosphate) 3'-pyrophosphohydrolase [Actinomycetes bacterium]MCP4958874.1 bifunctional (p)ppGpp synthetase/guanosine-3',5'-bis(diphosphate) 3'-pyrophosphohydrolase [Actinomycetes bacterium]